jgi:hypothetical protein
MIRIITETESIFPYYSIAEIGKDSREKDLVYPG